MGLPKTPGGIIARLACPKCKRIGRIIHQPPVPGRPGEGRRPRLVRDLSAGFVTVDFSSSQDARVECATCRVAAREH